MPPAYLRRVPHQRGDLLQALPLHRQLAAEGVAEDQAGPTSKDEERNSNDE